MSQEQNQSVDGVIDEALTQFFSGWSGPAVPDHILLAGSLAGFDPEWAELVLMDTSPGGSLEYLNGLFASYFEETEQILPYGMADKVAEEQESDKPKWNTAIVAETWGWGLPYEQWDERAGQELTRLKAMDFQQGETRELVGAATRGGKKAGTIEPWEKYFRTAHLLILVRRTDQGLQVGIQSKDETGPRELVLTYADGSQTVHNVQVSANEMWRLPDPVQSPDGQLPVTGCIRSVRS